ncbi:MAG: PilZ domain-containing protein [Erythrobacter sp.]
MDNFAGKPQRDTENRDTFDTEPLDASAATGDGVGNGARTAAGDPAPAGEAGNVEGRTAPRFTLLIRAAKLVSPHGEFVCVLRDVSDTGVCLRLFHSAPTGDPIELHMPGDGAYELRKAWERDGEAGYEFTRPIDVARFINEASEYPKRGLRIGVCFPIKLRTLSGTSEGVVENLSQQGARFECDALYAIDQSLFIDSPEGGPAFSDIRAKVRWRREKEYGVVFEDTLALSDFARLAARLQCPALLA